MSILIPWKKRKKDKPKLGPLLNVTVYGKTKRKIGNRWKWIDGMTYTWVIPDAMPGVILGPRLQEDFRLEGVDHYLDRDDYVVNLSVCVKEDWDKDPKPILKLTKIGSILALKIAKVLIPYGVYHDQE